jgi:hypothetical protein
VVDTNISYTYDVLERDIQGLKARYPFVETGSIGKSCSGVIFSISGSEPAKTGSHTTRRITRSNGSRHPSDEIREEFLNPTCWASGSAGMIRGRFWDKAAFT